MRSIWSGLPTLIRETKKKGDPALDGNDIDEELFPEQLAVEAGFALANPDDPRFIAAMKYRNHFGRVIHKAAVSFRDGNDGGEDHIDAVIGALKVNALRIFLISSSQYDLNIVNTRL